MKVFFVFALLFWGAGVTMAQQELIYAQAQGDSVTIFNIGARENCASQFAIAVSVNGNLITMTETDTIKEKMYCICSFDFNATITLLNPGHYTVNVYRQYLKKYGYMKDTLVFIGSTEFDIVNPGSTTQLVKVFQSECYQTTENSSPPHIPALYITLENFPNPFQPSTNVRYFLSKPEHVRMQIYDALGREIAFLVNGYQSEGSHEFQIPGDLFPHSGVYFCVMTAGGLQKTIKMAVTR